MFYYIMHLLFLISYINIMFLELNTILFFSIYALFIAGFIYVYKLSLINSIFFVYMYLSISYTLFYIYYSDMSFIILSLTLVYLHKKSIDIKLNYDRDVL